MQTNSVAWIGTTRVSDRLEPLVLGEGHGDVLVLVGLLLFGARLLLDQQVLDRFDVRDRRVGGIDRFGGFGRDGGFVEVGLGGLEVLEILLLGRLLFLDRFVRVFHRVLHLIHLRGVDRLDCARIVLPSSDDATETGATTPASAIHSRSGACERSRGQRIGERPVEKSGDR